MALAILGLALVFLGVLMFGAATQYHLQGESYKGAMYTVVAMIFTFLGCIPLLIVFVF